MSLLPNAVQPDRLAAFPARCVVAQGSQWNDCPLPSQGNFRRGFFALRQVFRNDQLQEQRVQLENHRMQGLRRLLLA
jgi:hypothetical protein